MADLNPELSYEDKLQLLALDYRRAYEEQLVAEGHEEDEVHEQLMLMDQKGQFLRKARVGLYDFSPSPSPNRASSSHPCEASQPHLPHQDLYARLRKAWDKACRILAS